MANRHLADDEPFRNAITAHNNDLVDVTQKGKIGDPNPTVTYDFAVKVEVAAYDSALHAHPDTDYDAGVVTTTTIAEDVYSQTANSIQPEYLEDRVKLTMKPGKDLSLIQPDGTIFVVGANNTIAKSSKEIEAMKLLAGTGQAEVDAISRRSDLGKTRIARAALTAAKLDPAHAAELTATKKQIEIEAAKITGQRFGS